MRVAARPNSLVQTGPHHAVEFPAALLAGTGFCTIRFGAEFIAVAEVSSANDAVFDKTEAFLQHALEEQGNISIARMGKCS